MGCNIRYSFLINVLLINPAAILCGCFVGSFFIKKFPALDTPETFAIIIICVCLLTPSMSHHVHRMPFWESSSLISKFDGVFLWFIESCANCDLRKSSSSSSSSWPSNSSRLCGGNCWNSASYPSRNVQNPYDNLHPGPVKSLGRSHLQKFYEDSYVTGSIVAVLFVDPLPGV